MANIHFFMPPSQLSVAKATGITGIGDTIVECPLHVGDVISFPEAPTIFWRVAARMLATKKAPAQSEWSVWLEQAPDPDSRQH